MQYRNNRTNLFSCPYPGRPAAKTSYSPTHKAEHKATSGGNPIARRYGKLFDRPLKRKIATASCIGSFYSLTGPCTVPQRQKKRIFASFRFLLPDISQRRNQELMTYFYNYLQVQWTKQNHSRAFLRSAMSLQTHAVWLAAPARKRNRRNEE